MPLKIELLRGFVAVARSGNLAAAAQTLGRTPSAVSMMLKQLESHLGEALFETDRKSRLTALGFFVLEQAERELQHFDQTVRIIEGYAKATYGSVRIATVPSVAGTILPQVFANYADNLEKLEIDIRDMDSSSVLHELSRDRIDIGIATLNENRAGLRSQLLMSDRFGVVCAPGHVLAQKQAPVTWDMLAGHRLIANNLSASITASEARMLHEQSRLSAHNLISILGMVRARIGITILPEMAARAGNSRDLVFLPLADLSAKRQLHLLSKAETALSPATQLLEKFIIETAQRMMIGGNS